METIENILQKILSIGIWLLIILIPILIALAYGCLVITGITFLYSVVTQQNYQQVLGKSTILNMINQVGKWTAVITGLISIFIITLLIII